MRLILLRFTLTLVLWSWPLQAAQSAVASVPIVRCNYEMLQSAHPDGIAKSYCGRQIARVMGWQGASWLDRPERIKEERIDLLITLLDLKPGMIVADIGAGTGRLSVQILDRVRPNGQVWAVDVQPEMVTKLQALARSEAEGGLRVVQSSKISPNLPFGIFDLAVMVDAYHEFEFPREMLEALKHIMKPGGHVVFVEYRANDPLVPIRMLHTMTLSQIRKEAESVGLVFERVLTSLPWQNVVIFKVGSSK